MLGILSLSSLGWPIAAAHTSQVQAIGVVAVVSNLDRLGLASNVRSLDIDGGRVTVTLEFSETATVEPEEKPDPAPVDPAEARRRELRHSFPGSWIPDGEA